VTIPTIRLDEFVDINPRTPVQRGVECAYVEMADITPGKRYVQAARTRMSGGSGSKFLRGDTLMARITPCLENGKIAQFVSSNSQAAQGSTEFWVFRAKHGISDPAYVFYLASTQAIRGPAEKSMAGASGRQRADIDAVRQVEVPAPPIEHQRRIVTVLSAYDDLIENNTRRITILEEVVRRIYEEWFVRFRFPGHERVRMVESELGLVPEGWVMKPFSAIADVVMGQSPKGDTYNEEGLGIPLVNGPVEFGDKFAKAIKWTTAPLKVCKPGDLIVCVRGSTTGKYVKSDGIYCLGRGVCAFSSQYQGFVDQTFAHQLPALLGQTSGSTFPSWTGPQLKNYRSLIPTPELLSAFERLVSPTSSAISVYSRQAHNLRTTRDFLLPKLISGELDVSSIPEPRVATA
jgi:type I restriction enzyme S subunit